MPIDDDLLKLVPIGEENAVSARLIWQRYGVWSAAHVRQKLNEMAARGLIKRKKAGQSAVATHLFYKQVDR